MKPIDFIHRENPTPGTHYACKDGFHFAMKHETMCEVWKKCPRPDWLLWILDKLNLKHERERRLFACWCAESTPGSAPLTDQRSINAVRVSRMFVDGMSTEEELRNAANAAWSAANEALSAWSAWSATSAAAWAARSAWSAAEGSAAAAARSAAEGSAAAAAARSAQANHLRALIPNPFEKE